MCALNNVVLAKTPFCCDDRGFLHNIRIKPGLLWTKFASEALLLCLTYHLLFCEMRLFSFPFSPRKASIRLTRSHLAAQQCSVQEQAKQKLCSALSGLHPTVLLLGQSPNHDRHQIIGGSVTSKLPCLTFLQPKQTRLDKTPDTRRGRGVAWIILHQHHCNGK